VQKITNKQYEEYQKLLDDKRHGRMLTPDGLRLICSACNYDPTEKRSSMTHLCKSQVVMLFFFWKRALELADVVAKYNNPKVSSKDIKIYSK